MSPPPPATFFVRTFGCQMNEHDSERMAQQLLAAGLEQVDAARHADLILINTCSVRAKPEHKALSEAGRYKHTRDQRGARIVLAGCVARQRGRALLERAPWLDAVIGPDAVGRLADIVARLAAGAGPLLDVADHTTVQPGFVPLGPDHGHPVCRHVTIMKGCDNFCSYCIVPLVRGREVSRAAEDVLAEVAELAGRGVRQVTLLGQNVNSYRDPDSGTGFAGLLRALDRQAAVDRIRFTSSHPKDLSPELIAAMAECPAVAEHLHLALQSGSDTVLERMGRGHDAAAFIQRVDALRQWVPGLALTTDLIAGFPGETEADFRATLEVVERLAFDGAFSFKYSPRPGTRAARELADDVPAAVKQDRLERLQTLIGELEKASLNKMVKREVEVLVEGMSVRDDRVASGRSRCDRVINFTPAGAGQPAPGSLVRVRIEQVRGHTLWGRQTGQPDATQPATG